MSNTHGKSTNFLVARSMKFWPIKSFKGLLLLFIIKSFPIYGQDDSGKPDFFFADDKIHGQTLVLNTGSFFEGFASTCDLTFHVSGLPEASYYECELCKTENEDCEDRRYSKSIFGRCLIPPSYGPGSVVSIRACVHPEMAWNPGKNCGPKLGQTIPVIESCDDENRLKASTSISKTELARVSAMSMSSDLFDYIRIEDQCKFTKVEDFDLNRFEPLFFTLGPEFLTESFRFSGLTLSDSQLSEIYAQIDEGILSSNVKKETLQLTAGDHELPTQRSRPLSATVIEKIGANRFGQLASSISRIVNSYGVLPISSASRLAADESYKMAADMFWIMSGAETDQQELRQYFQFLGQSAEFMAKVGISRGVKSISNAPGVKDTRQLINNGGRLVHAADELAGSLLTSYHESVQTYSNAKKSIAQESMELAEPIAAKDPEGFKNWINRWSDWMLTTSKSLEAMRSDVEVGNKILHNINNDPTVWDNLEKTANNTRQLFHQLREKVGPEAIELDPKKKAVLTRELDTLKGEVEKSVLELDSIVEDSLNKLDDAVGNNDKEFVQGYQVLYRRYFAAYPDLFASRYTIPDYQQLPDLELLDTDIPNEPRLQQLRIELGELDNIWQKPASDAEVVGRFEAKKKSIGILLNSIIENSLQSGIDRTHLNSLILALENASIIPKRYSRQIADALKSTSTASTKALEELDQVMNSLLEGIKEVKGNITSARNFFENLSPKLKILQNNLTDPRLYGSIKANAEEVFKNIQAIQSSLSIPDELPEDESNRKQVFQANAVRAGLERLGIIEPIWEEGWSGVFRNVYSSLGNERLSKALGVEQFKRLDQVIHNLETLEFAYFRILSDPADDAEKYQQLFILRKQIKKAKEVLNQEITEMSKPENSEKKLEISKAFNEAIQEINYKIPEKLSPRDLANRHLDRIIEATNLERAEANIRTFSSYFTSSGELSQKAIQMMNRILGNPDNLGDTEKSLFKFIGLSFPEEIHETVLSRLYEKKTEIDRLFDPSVYPPRTVIAGEEFGEKLADLVFGKWEDITDNSKKWWRDLGGRLGTKIRKGTVLYLNGRRTHNFLRGQIISYFKWKAFADEVVAISQEKYGVSITKADVWEHWARVSKDGRLVGLSKKIGSKVGDVVADKYLSILPGNLQAIAKSHLNRELREIIGDSARYKTTTLSGLKINVNNPAEYAADLFRYRGIRFGISAESKNAGVIDHINGISIKTRYISKALASGSILTAIILLEDFIGSHLEEMSDSQTECEPLVLLKSQYQAHKNLIKSLGFTSN